MIKSISVFYKKYFLYAKQVVHLALPPVRLPILHLRLPSVATMERVFPRKTQKKKLWVQWKMFNNPQKKEKNGKSTSKKILIQTLRHNIERRKTYRMIWMSNTSKFIYLAKKKLFEFSFREIHLSCSERHQAHLSTWK